MTTRRERRAAERARERAAAVDDATADDDVTAAPTGRRRDRRSRVRDGEDRGAGARGDGARGGDPAPVDDPGRAGAGVRTRRLDRSVAMAHHLLVLERPWSAAALAGVLVERITDLRTRRDDEILLGPGAVLTGPWEVTADLAAELDLPGTCAFVLRVRPDRGEPAPPELRGLDPLEDSFPEGSPQGDELVALENVVALARRLGGAVRVTGTGAVVVPDPAAKVDRLVRSEVELGATELAVLLDRYLDDVVILSDDIWGGGSSSVGGRMSGDGPEWARDMVTIEVTTVAPPVQMPAVRPRPTPQVVEGEGGRFVVPPLETPELGGTGGRTGDGNAPDDGATPGSVPGGRPVLTYEVRYRPGRPVDVLGTHPTRAGRRARRGGQKVVDGVAADLVGLIGGHVVDDDGFHRGLPGATD